MDYGILKEGTRMFRGYMSTLWRINQPQAWFGEYEMITQMVVDYGSNVAELKAAKDLYLLKMDSPKTIKSLIDIFTFVLKSEEYVVREFKNAFQILINNKGEEYVFRITERDVDLRIAKEIQKIAVREGVEIHGWYHLNMESMPSSNNKGILRAEVMLLDGPNMTKQIGFSKIQLSKEARLREINELDKELRRNRKSGKNQDVELTEEEKTELRAKLNIQNKRPPPGTPEGTPTKPPPKRNRDGSPGEGPSSGRRLFGTPSPPRTPKPNSESWKK